jgi:beta-N-acetylhexosaminidase
MDDRALHLDDAVGQCVMVGFHGHQPSRHIVELIERERVGGVILFARNISDARQLAELTAELQAIARAADHPAPLLIAIDQENGLVERLGPTALPLPGNMALGAVADEKVTQQVAEMTGRELRALGINLNLAPVADVNNNPANPAIGVRSFGDDPALVGGHVAAAVRGYRRAGIASTLKHFPGHGDTTADSHCHLPVVPHDLSRLRTVELVPFRHGIAASAPVVMTAHLALPALTGSASLPATISAEVVTGLLRDELGFGGLIMTDCLEMEGLSKTVGTVRGAVGALRAGHDLALISHNHRQQLAALRAIRAAIHEGALDADAIAASAQRVLQLKRQLSDWSARETLSSAHLEIAHQALSDEVYARSTTLVRDRLGLLPMRRDPARRIAVVGYTEGKLCPPVDRVYSLDALTALVREQWDAARVDEVIVEPGQSCEERARACQQVAAADIVLLATLNAHLDAEQCASLRAVLPAGAGGGRIIGIAVGNPYDAVALPEIGTYLATYEYTVPALRAAVGVIFGERRASGTLPVSA